MPPIFKRAGSATLSGRRPDQDVVDQRRHLVLVAGNPRRLTYNFWRLFTLLYRHRGDVVDNDRICAKLYDEAEQPVAATAVRENVCAG
jgi:DNA-binding response OmpR family regulator